MDGVSSPKDLANDGWKPYAASSESFKEFCPPAIAGFPNLFHLYVC
jgi:hypothetical protein